MKTLSFIFFLFFILPSNKRKHVATVIDNLLRKYNFHSYEERVDLTFKKKIIIVHMKNINKRGLLIN